MGGSFTISKGISQPQVSPFVYFAIRQTDHNNIGLWSDTCLPPSESIQKLLVCHFEGVNQNKLCGGGIEGESIAYDVCDTHITFNRIVLTYVFNEYWNSIDFIYE